MGGVAALRFREISESSDESSWATGRRFTRPKDGDADALPPELPLELPLELPPPPKAVEAPKLEDPEEWQELEDLEEPEECDEPLAAPAPPTAAAPPSALSTTHPTARMVMPATPATSVHLMARPRS